MKRERFSRPETVSKYSNGGRRKFVPLWMTRNVTVTEPDPAPVETVKRKTYSITFKFSLWWLLEAALIAATIYLLAQSCMVPVN